MSEESVNIIEINGWKESGRGSNTFNSDCSMR